MDTAQNNLSIKIAIANAYIDGQKRGKSKDAPTEVYFVRVSCRTKTDYLGHRSKKDGARGAMRKILQSDRSKFSPTEV
jgi:hypothetical protein